MMFTLVRCFAVAVFIVSFFHCPGQSLRVIDSLHLLKNAALNKLELEPAEAEKLVFQSIAMAEKAKLDNELAEAWYLLGRVYYHQYRSDEAIESFHKAKDLYYRNNDSFGVSRSYNGAGNIYKSRISDYPKALEYYLKAKAYAPNTRARIAALQNMGGVYEAMKQHDKALEIARETFVQARELGDFLVMANALDGMGGIYSGKRDYEKSIEYKLQAISIYKSLSVYETTARSLTNLGIDYIHNQQLKEASEVLHEALAMSKQYKFPGREINALYAVSDLYYERKQYDSCEFYLKQAEELIGESNIHRYDEFVFSKLSRLYKAIDEKDLSLHYFQKYTEVIDSVRKAAQLAKFEAIAVNLEEPEVSEKRGGGVGFWGIGILLLATGAVALMAVIKRKSGRNTVVFQHDEAILAPKPDPREADALPGGVKQIAVKSEIGFKHVEVDSIWWFQHEISERAYYAYLENVSYRVKLPMTELENNLPEKFFRINRSVIINLEKIDSYSFWENHKYILRMRDRKKTEFTISRNRLKELRQVVTI